MKKARRILMLLLLIPGMLFAADTYYDSGSQMFTITAGVTTPFIYYDQDNPDHPVTMWPGMDETKNTKRTIGGIAAIAYQVFLNPYIALGGELGFQFDFANDGNVETNVPIFLKMTYMPYQTGKIEVPISIGAGLLYAGYKSFSKLTFGCNVEVGVRFYITDSWGIGVNVGMYVFPEIYASNPEWNSTMTYIPATLSVTYRH